MHLSSVVGVDGAKQGRWAAFGIDAGGTIDFELCESFAAVWARWRAAARVLVDIPIGLPDARRRCDLDAKRILGAQHARVFLTPPRAVLDATTYVEAAARCRAASGLGLSKQAWNIVPRIREVDDFLRATPAARAVVHEAHPEICFWALSSDLAGSRTPVALSKATPEGIQARLAILERCFPGARSAIDDAARRVPRSLARLDDLVDAMVCAITARAPELEAIPRDPPVDATGLPMRIVHARG